MAQDVGLIVGPEMYVCTYVRVYVCMYVCMYVKFGLLQSIDGIDGINGMYVWYSE